MSTTPKKKASGFNLPEGFNKFKIEKDFQITDSISFTLRLPGTIEASWAMANNNSDPDLGDVEYPARIIAACLTKVNGVPLHRGVNEGDKQVAQLLMPSKFDGLTEQMKHRVFQWIYENIVSKIPLNIYTLVYFSTIEIWISSSGGMINSNIDRITAEEDDTKDSVEDDKAPEAPQASQSE